MAVSMETTFRRSEIVPRAFLLVHGRDAGQEFPTNFSDLHVHLRFVGLIVRGLSTIPSEPRQKSQQAGLGHVQ